MCFIPHRCVYQGVQADASLNYQQGTQDGKGSLSVKNPDQEKSLYSSCMHDSLMCLSDALTTTHRAERPA